MKFVIALLFILIVIFMLVGKPRSIEQKIAETKNKKCKVDAPCIVRIKDLTDFSWDRMYAFKYNTTEAQTEEALGTAFPNYIEFTPRIVFLKDGKIVYREDQLIDDQLEGPVDGEVHFDIPDSEVYKSYTPDSAVFQINIRKFEKATTYDLEQVK